MTSHEAYLRSALSKYRYVDLTKREILNVFQSFVDLRPNLDSFVFNDGTKKELLCLIGTIPVQYKGKTYNIPICVWLMDTHPYNPPMVYVKPTPTMQIKPGRHVDNTGRVYLPYLHEWKHPSSDLLGLIQILAIVFGEEPPVFSKPGPAVPYPTAGPGGAAQPPYPTAGSVMPMPTPGYQAQGSGAVYPPAGPAYQPPGGPAYPPQYPAAAGYNPVPNTQYPGYPPTTQAGFYPPYPTTQSYPTQSASQPAIDDNAIRMSLMSAVEDKLRRRLKEIFAQKHAEMETLKRTQEDLQKGRQTLENMLQKLEREQTDVERNISLLQEKDSELTEALSKMENREQVDIDDTVVPTTPLYKQLLNAFAEEQATEDAIYYMGEALRKGVIDLDVFLKQVRELSRKQFMLRMLLIKCRQKAGLPDISG